MRSDDVCLMVALDVKMLCFDLLHQPHIHRDHWHKGKSLKHRSLSVYCFIASAVYCFLWPRGWAAAC